MPLFECEKLIGHRQTASDFGILSRSLRDFQFAMWLSLISCQNNILVEVEFKEPASGAEVFIPVEAQVRRGSSVAPPLLLFGHSLGVYALLHSFAWPVNIRAHRPEAQDA